jgi:predicted DNA-binding transcriptional regulator YafY
MRNTIERRFQILMFLCRHKHETLDNLACEFNVSKRTIRYDIEVLSCFYPIYAVTGTYGGIYIADGFRLGMKYLTDKQYEILYQISERLDGEEKTVVLGILKTFAYPKKGVDGKKSNT